MPYLFPEERLAVALEVGDGPLWYYRLLADPLEFFLEMKRAERVILVGAGEPGGRGEGLDRPSEPVGGERFDIDFEAMGDNRELMSQVDAGDPEWSGYIGSRRLLIKSHAESVLLARCWEMRFFARRKDEEALRSFRECISRILGTSPDSRERFARALKEAIVSRSRRQELRACYRMLASELNNACLVLYHGPIGRDSAGYALLPSCHGCHMHCSHSPWSWQTGPCCSWMCWGVREPVPRRYGHLLTGDCNLSPDVAFSEFATHFGRHTGSVLVCQVPHHGSRNGWNHQLPSLFHRDTLWVVSADPFNTSYPSADVVAGLVTSGRPLCVVGACNPLVLWGYLQQ